MTDQERPEGKDGGAIEDVLSDEDEHDCQGHGDDDFGIDDGNLVDVFQQASKSLLAVEEADGTKRTDQCGYDSADGGDDEGITQGSEGFLVGE